MPERKQLYVNSQRKPVKARVPWVYCFNLVMKQTETILATPLAALNAECQVDAGVWLEKWV